MCVLHVIRLPVYSFVHDVSQSKVFLSSELSVCYVIRSSHYISFWIIFDILLRRSFLLNAHLCNIFDKHFLFRSIFVICF